MLPISCVIIAKNEERHISRAIESVTWCQECLVVDSGSTDKTWVLAQSLGARVFAHEFNGHGQQKRWAISQAQHDWILNIDADEVVSPELAQEIQNILAAHPNPRDVFFLPIPLYFLGCCLQNNPKKGNIRLFNRQHSQFSECVVHEYVKHAGQTHYLKNPIIHHSYDNLSDYFSKFNQYTSLAAQEMKDKDRFNFPLLALVLCPLTFVHFYFFKGFFLKGLPGLVWSFVCSFYPSIKRLKYYYLKHPPACS
ncbi:MAG: glycosyltransferase family 2 protein [Pseudomonadota bacterium]